MLERQGLSRQSTAEFYVWSAAATIFGRTRKARAGGLWAMLSAYFDESGTHKGSPVCVVAGLVASPARWERLATSWARMLASADIPDFHASDCVTGGGVFQGWDPRDREKLYRRCVNLIKRTAAFRVWTVVIMEDFHAYYNDESEKKPYRVCAIGCASRVQHLAAKRGPSFIIPYVFDQGPKGKWMYAAFDRLVTQGRGSHYYRMGSIERGDRRSMLPLQAADLHAYEVYRYFADQWRTGRQDERSEFRELLAIPDVGGYLMTGSNLETLNNDLHRQDEAGIEEPIRLPVSWLTRESGIKLIKP